MPVPPTDGSIPWLRQRLLRQLVDQCIEMSGVVDGMSELQYQRQMGSHHYQDFRCPSCLRRDRHHNPERACRYCHLSSPIPPQPLPAEAICRVSTREFPYKYKWPANNVPLMVVDPWAVADWLEKQPLTSFLHTEYPHRLVESFVRSAIGVDVTTISGCRALLALPLYKLCKLAHYYRVGRKDAIYLFRSFNILNREDLAAKGWMKDRRVSYFHDAEVCHPDDPPKPPFFE